MIEIKNVYKSFGKKRVLNNLSIKIEKGEIYGLLGANGAGKSTTLNLLLGFLKVDKGTIDIMDDFSNEKIQPNEIGYINENVNLYPYLSGLENLDYFSRLADLKLTKKQLNNILVECGLQSDAINKRVLTYSKGMRQKVGISIAYAKNAKIFVLDEPASGLDPISSNELSYLLKKMSLNGATIIMASHDIFRITNTCHKIGILKNGELIKEMNVNEVNSDELEQMYIDYMTS